MDTVIYLIRHSEVTPKNNIKMINEKNNEQIINEKAILSVSGEKKAEELSKIPELANLDAIYSSNYVRSMETAKYLALENNLVINVDDRLGERKVGEIGDLEFKELLRLQRKDFNFKLSGGESINQTKKRMVEALKSILLFEAGNRVAIISHATAITALLSTWCDLGYNYDDDIILSYGEETIIDGNWTAPYVVKVIFDGKNVKSIEYLNII